MKRIELVTPLPDLTRRHPEPKRFDWFFVRLWLALVVSILIFGWAVNQTQPTDSFDPRPPVAVDRD